MINSVWRSRTFASLSMVRDLERGRRLADLQEDDDVQQLWNLVQWIVEMVVPARCQGAHFPVGLKDIVYMSELGAAGQTRQSGVVRSVPATEPC
jgi:hypothetical protein